MEPLEVVDEFGMKWLVTNVREVITKQSKPGVLYRYYVKKERNFEWFITFKHFHIDAIFLSNNETHTRTLVMSPSEYKKFLNL